MKEVITIGYVNGRYRVTSLTNRREPRPGAYLAAKEVDDLLTETKTNGNLTVHVNYLGR